MPVPYQPSIIDNDPNQNLLISVVGQMQAQIEKLTILLQYHERVLNTETAYRTIRGFCSMERIKYDRKLTRALGKIASRICRKENIMIDLIPDLDYGDIGSYPVNIIRRAVKEYEKDRKLPINVLSFPDQNSE